MNKRITYKQAAKLLGVDEGTVILAIRQGRLKAHPHIERRHILLRADVEAFAANPVWGRVGRPRKKNESTA